MALCGRDLNGFSDDLIYFLLFLTKNCLQNSCKEFSLGFFHNRADGVMRTMSTEKLLKTVPIIQNQMDALLDFNVSLAACIFLTYHQLVVQTCKRGQD